MTSQIGHHYRLLSDAAESDTCSEEIIMMVERRPLIQRLIGFNGTALLLLATLAATAYVFVKGSQPGPFTVADVTFATLYRSKPIFWKVDMEEGRGEKVIWIKPLDASTRVAPDGLLDLAIFSARLQSDSDPLFLRSLPEPTLHSMGHTYKLTVPSTLSLPPDSTYTIEISLHFGQYPFSCDRICTGDVCTGQEVYGLSQLSYLPELAVQSLANLTYTPQVLFSPEQLPLCQTYSSLSGWWYGKDFTPDGCSLPPPRSEELREAFVARTEPNSVTWLHFIGDSIVRDGTLHLFIALGMDYSWYEDISDGWGPTNKAGAALLPGNRTLVITYRTWFRCDLFEPLTELCPLDLLDTVVNPQKFSDVYDVDHPLPADGISIHDFDAPRGHQFDISTFHLPTSPPDKVYLSLGAHSVHLQAYGLSHFWRDAAPIFKKALPRLVILLHTFVDTRIIPAKYAWQGIVRNNHCMSWFNTQLKEVARQHGIGVVDWGGITDAPSGKIYTNTVHPPAHVYTQMFLAAFGEWLSS